MGINATRVTAEDNGTYSVGVQVYVNGCLVGGEVTMMRRPDGRPGYVACGASRDAWVSGGVLAMLDRELGEEDMRAFLGEIEAVASAAIERAEGG